MHRPGVELAIFRSLVRRPNHYTTVLQIYHQKKEAYERELQQRQQQRDTATARQLEDERTQRSRLPASGDSALPAVIPGPSEPQLPSHRQQVQQLNVREPETVLSHVERHVKHEELDPRTMSSSLPILKSNVLPQNKQPQSFPDRLASIQKQKEMEESKTFARSSIRALKVSNYVDII